VPWVEVGTRLLRRFAYETHGKIECCLRAAIREIGSARRSSFTAADDTSDLELKGCRDINNAVIPLTYSGFEYRASYFEGCLHGCSTATETCWAACGESAATGAATLACGHLV
jgi:hypothetical protein